MARTNSSSPPVAAPKVAAAAAAAAASDVDVMHYLQYKAAVGTLGAAPVPKQQHVIDKQE